MAVSRRDSMSHREEGTSRWLKSKRSMLLLSVEMDTAAAAPPLTSETPSVRASFAAGMAESSAAAASACCSFGWFNPLSPDLRLEPACALLAVLLLPLDADELRSL